MIGLPVPGLDSRSPEVSSLSVSDLHPICHRCRGIIRPDAPRWSAREPDEFWHYKCAEEAGLASGDRFKAMVAARSTRSNLG
jgi:hypothetical protein